MFEKPHNMTKTVLFYLAYVAYRLLASTWRVKHVNPPAANLGARIYGHFHGDELFLISAFSNKDLGVMVSLSKDGEIQAKLLGRLGYVVVRGSSSRGGAGGLKGLIDLVLQKGISAS